MEIIVRHQEYRDGEKVGDLVAVYCRECGRLMFVADPRNGHCPDCLKAAITGARQYFFEIPTVYYYSPKVQGEERHFVYGEDEFNRLKKRLREKYGIKHQGGQDD